MTVNRAWYDSECLFCRIVAGEEPSEKVTETADFLVIKNKYPIAPVHVLVLDKKHRVKKDTVSGVYAKEPGGYWDKLFEAIFATITQLGLDQSGYKLVNNGAGYNHFEHEHFHVLGGTETEPGGST
ncbi:HIT domain-containing protein [Patescibacteria group bacterium]|nr:HIT domain-containing protein [Patescibacteria group bacterium]MBU1970708.1 HIT domain-containing protein [Patescibacteria group bacterium]